jgi:hypothetical protein
VATFPALGFDPAPGDVSLTRGLARQLGGIASELRTTVSDIDRMSCGDWKGKASVAFADHVAHDVEPLLIKARDSFDKASHALADWANLLEGFQHEARSLEREAAAKQADLATARHTATTAAHTAAASAATAADTAAAHKAHQALTEANAAVSGVHQRAQELHDRYNQAAKRIGGRLDKAGDIAPDKPGFFSRMVHDVEDAWHDTAQWLHDHADMIAHIGDILSAISGVLGVIAIITAPFEPIGAIFAGAAAATSGLALLAHLTAKAEGADVSWVSIGLDAFGALPGVTGFAKGAKVADEAAGLAKAAKLGSGLKVAALGGEAGEEATKSASLLTKTFKLFGGEGNAVVKGSSLAGRFKAGALAAAIKTEGGQLAGTKAINTLTKLPFVKATQLIDPMSDLGRGVDSSIKGFLTGHKIGQIAVDDFGFGH